MTTQQALGLLTATIANCEKMQPKFVEGSAQYSLLKHRIYALRICEHLLQGGDVNRYSPDELAEALAPIRSIIHKCTQAQRKHAPGSATYQRLSPMIETMQLCLALLEAAQAT